MSDGKLTFIVQTAVAKAAKTRLSSLAVHHLHAWKTSPSIPGVVTHSQESWTLAACPVSMSAGPLFLPAPLHDAFLLLFTMVLASMCGLLGPELGSLAEPCPLGSTSQLEVAEAKGFPIAVAGLLEHWAAGTQEMAVHLAVLSPP